MSFKVDIFGACGKKRCSREKDGDCWKMVERDYKFYLSFENSICKDYVTEKFFNAMKYNLIPIVLGGADYNEISPFHSVIQVAKDYEDPLRLANLIQDLDADDEKYAEYFWWKEYYEVRMGPQHRAQAFCALCQRLNEDPFVDKSIYSHLDKWWEDKAKCRSVHNTED